jgi:glycosyltransferase involved in cell wall biosynthesis
VAAFIALGERHKEALTWIAGVPADRIHVIHNGIDADSYDRPDLRGLAREQLGLADDPETVAVGLIANLRGVKRPDIFIEAARRVRAVRKNVRFFLIGDGPCRSRVEQYLETVDAGHSYIRLMGERPDVSTLMQGLDLVCLSSRQECFSLAMLEAMAAGKAFIAPRVGSLDEALQDARTGVFLPELSADALAAAIQRLADSPVERARLGEAAQFLVHSEFRVENMVESMAALVASFQHPA